MRTKKNKFDLATITIEKRSKNLSLSRLAAEKEIHTLVNPARALSDRLDAFRDAAILMEKSRRNRILEIYNNMIDVENKEEKITIDYAIVYSCIIETLVICWTRKHNELIYALQILADLLKLARIYEEKWVILNRDTTNNITPQDKTNFEDAWHKLNELSTKGVNEELAMFDDLNNDNLRLAGIFLILAKNTTNFFDISEKRELNPKFPGDKTHSAILIELKPEFLNIIPKEGHRLNLTRNPHMFCPPVPHTPTKHGGLLFAQSSKETEAELIKYLKEEKANLHKR